MRMIRALLLGLVLLASCSQYEQVVQNKSAMTTAWPTTAWGVETPYWIPDQMSWPVYGWDDTLGHRVDNCYNPYISIGDIKIFSQYYTGSCAKLHGVISTQTKPFGFYFDTDYVTATGWDGIDTVDWSTPAQIQSFIVAAGSHALLCAGSLTLDIPGMPCTGQHITVRADTIDQGNGPIIPFRVTSLAVGKNASPPPLCPYLTITGGIRPAKEITCDRIDASGYTQVVAGDGLPRDGGYVIIGNPITGPLAAGGFGAPCLGQDFSGNYVVFVYPAAGSQSNPTCP